MFHQYYHLVRVLGNSKHLKIIYLTISSWHFAIFIPLLHITLHPRCPRKPTLHTVAWLIFISSDQGRCLQMFITRKIIRCHGVNLHPIDTLYTAKSSASLVEYWPSYFFLLGGMIYPKIKREFSWYQPNAVKSNIRHCNNYLNILISYYYNFKNWLTVSLTQLLIVSN